MSNKKGITPNDRPQNKRPEGGNRATGNPAILGLQLFLIISLAKDKDLQYVLDGEASIKLSIRIAKLFKENYEFHFDDSEEYYNIVLDTINRQRKA